MTTFPSHIRTRTFQHGIHPLEYKHLSRNCPVERMPFAENYTLPLSQHTGAPSRSVVRKGDKVRRGQVIAVAAGFVSVPLHSPVDGAVTAIGPAEHPNGQMAPCIRIRADAFSTQQLETKPPLPPEEMNVKEFIASVQQAGLVGMGGAAFPAHVKFSIPEGKRCRYILLNGCECEPFLTADHRTMMEYPGELLDGISILQHFLHAEKIYIGIEANKPDAIALLEEKKQGTPLPLEVVPLAVKYPQGAEKMMIAAILRKEVPSGKLPIDLETLVSNVGTAVALSQWFRKGQPLIERLVTITGTAVRRPANVLIPIGTSMREAVELCGGITGEAARIVLGGPMMGMVQKSLDVPVVKGTSGILVLTKREVREITGYRCIRCSRCVGACPMFLNPSLLGLLAKKGLWEEMQENNVMDCFECGSCSFVCPSGIPLVQGFRVAKGILKERQSQAKQKG